jgi:DMSO/TMAO reductase YedYZ molybdopterin-dependent catalytic subunit
VAGRVKTPLSLNLADLRAMSAVEMACVLECAGNGRSGFALPSTSGTQWGLGAVGNARWTGVRLASVLERAGLEPDAAHVWFECADSAPLPETPRFLRSIPLQKVADDVLLASEMNGAPLPHRHGAPLRVIVPGWFGMASAKWVTRIRVETAPSDNHFMARGYHYIYPGEDPASAPPVDELRVKSVITRPREGEKLSFAQLSAGKPKTGKQSVVKARIMGFAWAGPKGIKLVEISSDGGNTWQAAGFMGDTEPHSWRLWATEVPIVAGQSVTVIARATDNAGQVQPLTAQPNAGGYGNNSMHKVTFRVGA